MKTLLKCPKCRRILSRTNSTDCPVCGKLIKITQKTCSRFILEKERLDFGDLKTLFHNWPLGIQQEFLEAVAAFKVKNIGIKKVQK